MRTALLVTFLALSFLGGCAGPARSGSDVDPHAAAQKNVTFLVEQGRAYADAGDALRAQQYFAAAMKAGGDEKAIFPLLLRACVAQRNYRLAVEYAEQTLARHPKNSRLRFLTGALHGQVGDTARSRGHLERAAEELPADPEVQFAVGVFFRDEAADLVSADRYFRQYLALAPDGNHAEEAKSSVMERVQ